MLTLRAHWYRSRDAQHSNRARSAVGMPGTVEKQVSLDMLDLNRRRRLDEVTVRYSGATLRWPWLRDIRANRWSVELQFEHFEGKQSIPIMWSWCNFGGYRPWFRCPYCPRRVRKLYYASGFCGCRTCCNLRYASQRRGAKSRRYLQALRLRLRLNGVASISAPFPERPRRMHKTTYFRLRRRAEMLEQDLRNSRFMSRKTDYFVLAPK
jgi:hypothetical protein